MSKIDLFFQDRIRYLAVLTYANDTCTRTTYAGFFDSGSLMEYVTDYVNDYDITSLEVYEKGNLFFTWKDKRGFY